MRAAYRRGRFMAAGGFHRRPQCFGAQEVVQVAGVAFIQCMRSCGETAKEELGLQRVNLGSVNRQEITAAENPIADRTRKRGELEVWAKSGPSGWERKQAVLSCDICAAAELRVARIIGPIPGSPLFHLRRHVILRVARGNISPPAHGSPGSSPRPRHRAPPFTRSLRPPAPADPSERAFL